MFDGGTRHTETTHASKRLATGVGCSPKDRSTSVTGHVFGAGRPRVEPGRQTRPNRRKD
jgi:hypothetical protein